MIPSEGPQRVVVEFLPSSKGLGKRGIRLSHSGQQVPPQLQGRMDPVSQDQACLLRTFVLCTGFEQSVELSRGHGQVS